MHGNIGGLHATVHVHACVRTCTWTHLQHGYVSYGLEPDQFQPDLHTTLCGQRHTCMPVP